MTEPVLRRAGPSDAESLVALRVLMLSAMGLPTESLDDPAWRAAAATWFVERLADGTLCAVVADVDGRAVSTASGQVTGIAPSPHAPSGRIGLLFNVATVPGHRGRGLASRCTDAVLTWFEEETEVERVDLFTTAAATRMYASRGFEATNQPAMRRLVVRRPPRP